MNNKIKFTSIVPRVDLFSLVFPLFAILLCGTARGACLNDPPHCQDIDVSFPCSLKKNVTYGGKIGDTIDAQFSVYLPSTTKNVYWGRTPGTNCVIDTQTTMKCGDMKIDFHANKSTPVLASLPVKITGKFSEADFRLTATDSDDTDLTCGGFEYVFHTGAGGWGDPHITTVDGVNYDFQSAGEFTALRGNGLEIQTRQTPVATTYIPKANDYTGLQSCVSLYSAVATRVCNHRVSYQPNISGIPDPSSMQLHVDGVLTTLGSDGISLRCAPTINSPTHDAIATSITGGRIVKSPVGDGIEIYYPDGTQLIVKSAWWPDQQKWYLNVDIYGTKATEGIFGKLAKDSWLPGLPDGTSLGPKPQDMHERYIALYETFANAWRVTDDTSLFDYAPGTSTATFTNPDGWPRENPTSCAIEGERSAKPVDVSVAEEYCSAIVDKNMKANCVFDVSVTGHTGFAQTYLLTEQLQPGATETTVKDDTDPTKYGENVTFTATVAQKVPRNANTPVGTVQFKVDGVKVGNPVTLDANGKALWSTSGLELGKHQIVAEYTPTGWGGLFTASNSQETHMVIEASHDDIYFWLIALLIIILLLIVLKKYDWKLW